MTTKELLEYKTITAVTENNIVQETYNCTCIFPNNQSLTLKKQDYDEVSFNSIGHYIRLKGELDGIIGKIIGVEDATFDIEFIIMMGE